MADEVFEQNPQNSRRNLLPMKCINRSLLMGHEHVSRALVELLQIRKKPSGADRVLHDAPEAFDRIEVRPTMGRKEISRFPSGVCWHRQTLPLHPGVQHPQDEVKDTMIAQFALWPALGHREVRQDKYRELWFGELDGNRCRCRLLCRGAHHAMASWEEW